jgi:hypothetical protein
MRRASSIHSAITLSPEVMRPEKKIRPPKDPEAMRPGRFYVLFWNPHCHETPENATKKIRPWVRGHRVRTEPARAESVVFGGARCAAWPIVKVPPKKKQKTRGDATKTRGDAPERKKK